MGGGAPTAKSCYELPEIRSGRQMVRDVEKWLYAAGNLRRWIHPTVSTTANPRSMNPKLSSSRPVHAAFRQLVSILSICGLLALPVATTQGAASTGTGNGAASAQASASALAAAKQKVEQLKTEFARLQEDRRKLATEKPRLDVGRHSEAERRRHEIAVKEWQAKVDALAAQAAEKRAALTAAQKEVAALGGSSGGR